MALTRKQRRLRDILLTLGALLVLVLLFTGQTLVRALFLPEMPGYAKTAPSGSYTPLAWKSLQAGRWDERTAPAVPAAVRAQAGKPVMLRGFLLPLHQPGQAAEFFIAEKPRGCYFCNPPGIAEVVHVKIAGGRELVPTDWPVVAYGTLHVATGAPDDAALYEIHDTVLQITRSL